MRLSKERSGKREDQKEEGERSRKRGSDRRTDCWFCPVGVRGPSRCVVEIKNARVGQEKIFNLDIHRQLVDS